MPFSCKIRFAENIITPCYKEELVNFSLRTNTDELLEKTLYPNNFIDGQIKQ